MNKTYQNTQVLRFSFMVIAMIIVILSTFFTNRLARALSIEERKKVETVAEATKQFSSSNENTDLNLILKVLQDNTTIPVILIDEKENIICVHREFLPQPDGGRICKLLWIRPSRDIQCGK